MRTIGELLDKKGTAPVHTVNSQDSLFTAVTRMVEMNIGAVLVVDEQVISGILSERDYLRFIAREGHSARETPVNDIMTRRVIYVNDTTTLDSVMATMTEARVRHMPVMKEGRLAGIVSIGDLVKQISDNMEAEINILQDYINVGYPGPNPSQSAEG